LDVINDKVGTDMAEKKPRSTFGHSCLESHKILNVIGSPKFRYFIGLSCCGSGFAKGLSGLKRPLEIGVLP
jgi:hypothetical protein